MRTHNIKRRFAILLSVATILTAPFLAGGISSAASTACGSVCNGHTPGYRSCSNSSFIVYSGYPKAFPSGNKTFNDPYLPINVYYSRSCQTVWATVTVKKTLGRSFCDIRLIRHIGTMRTQVYRCPATGHTTTTTMMDDSGGSRAVEVLVTEGLKSGNKLSMFSFYF